MEENKGVSERNERKVCVITGGGSGMGDAGQIVRTNAVGTIYINTEFAKVMEDGSCILDVSSMSAYLTPSIVMPRKKVSDGVGRSGAIWRADYGESPVVSEICSCRSGIWNI